MSISGYPNNRAKRLRINNFFSGLNSALDESVLPLSVAAETYNFDFSGGALKEGFGTEPIALTGRNNIASAWVYKRAGEPSEVLMYADKNGQVYYVFEGAEYALYGVKLNGKIQGINYRLRDEDVILICSDSDSMVVWGFDNAPYTVSASPSIKAMVMHSERMFVAENDGETLRFSDDLDPTNWTEALTQGGYIKLVDDRGRIGGLVSFLGYVYVLRDHGISRLVAYGDQTEFSVVNLFVSGGRIFPQSAALCGDRVIFLSSDGLYQFDGLNTRKILGGLDGLIEPDSAAAGAYFGGRYYLACKLKGTRGAGCENSPYTNNGLIGYELSTGNYSVTRGVDISAFVPTENSVLCVSGGKIAQIVQKAVNMGENLPKKWTSPFSDLGSERPKLLKEFHIFSEGGLLVTVESEQGKTGFEVKGGMDSHRAVLNLRGTRFRFVIESNEPCPAVARPTLVVVEY